MNIPEEAVEKAAAAIYELDDEYTPYLVARAALEAAYPAIRHMAAREALDGLIAKHDQSTSRHPDGSSARFDEQRAAFRIMAYRDAEYPESD